MGSEESSQKVSSYLPDDTIGAFADNILDLVLIGYIEGDLPGSSRGRALMTHFENGFFGSLSLWVIVSFKNPWDPVEKRPNTVHGGIKREPGIENSRGRVAHNLPIQSPGKATQ